MQQTRPIELLEVKRRIGRAQADTTGDRTGKITIVLRRGSYAVSLATPATTQSTPGLAFSGSYALSRLPLIDPRTGSYTLVVTWTDSAGVSLIAELPVAITS